MESFLQELRYAFRSLARTPGTAVAAVACLALGIGANSVMFGVVDALLLSPPPHVQNADRIVRINVEGQSRRGERYTSSGLGFPTYVDMQDSSVAFEAVAGYFRQEVSLGQGPDAQSVFAGRVTASYFPLLGVRPAAGRFFGADEDRPTGTGRVAVLSHGLWRRSFNADPSVFGREIQVGKDLYAVIGVTPRGFEGADLNKVDLWLPIANSDFGFFGPAALTSRGSFWVRILARLREDERREAAAQRATLAYRRGMAGSPNDDSTALVKFSPVQQARGFEALPDAKVALWAGVVSAIVLLIACANVSNILLARATRRRRELAVRTVLGAGRIHLARQVLAEAAVLGASGGVAGLLVALLGGPAIQAFLVPVYSADLGVTARVAGFMALVTLAAVALTGILPAFRASRPDLITELKAGTHGGSIQHGRLRSALLVGQVALTLTLLVGAGLFIRSLQGVHRMDLGFRADSVVLARMDLRSAGFSREAIDQLYADMRARLNAVPGITVVAATANNPFGSASGLAVRGFEVDQESLNRQPGGGPYYQSITPSYFSAIGGSVLAGREFTEADRAGAEQVMIVNNLTARAAWPGQDPLGKCARLGSDTACTRVVGVVADAMQWTLTEERRMLVYLPLAQARFSAPTSALIIRASGSPQAMAATIRRVMHSVSPSLPYADVRVLSEVVDPQFRPWRMGVALFGAFSLLGLLLAAVGLYALLAYVVTQRTYEIGLRVALGADAAAVRWLVIRQGLLLALAGTTVGAMAAVAGGRAIASLLYGVSSADPVTLVSGAAVLLAVSVLASYLPARRATRVDPMVALRSE